MRTAGGRPVLYDDQAGGTGIGGSNFTLQLGKGYALFSDKAGSIMVTGTRAPAQAVALASGWTVGFADAISNRRDQAYDILSTLLRETRGGYAEVNGLRGRGMESGCLQRSGGQPSWEGPTSPCSRAGATPLYGQELVAESHHEPRRALEIRRNYRRLDDSPTLPAMAIPERS